MMATVSELTARREALQQARATGAREVESGGEKIAYRSDAALAAAIADIDNQIAQAEGRTPIKSVRVIANRGFS